MSKRFFSKLRTNKPQAVEAGWFIKNGSVGRTNELQELFPTKGDTAKVKVLFVRYRG
jgi:hypothetical protein